MSELEIEIGRTLGPSCFFIYHSLKNVPDFTFTDVEIETGLSRSCVESSLSKMLDSNILERELKFNGSSRRYVYKANNKHETWKFH